MAQLSCFDFRIIDGSSCYLTWLGRLENLRADSKIVLRTCRFSWVRSSDRMFMQFVYSFLIIGWIELLLGRLGSFDIKALAAFKSMKRNWKFSHALKALIVNKTTFIFEMRMRAPFAFVDQIQFMVAILIDEITTRKLIRVVTYWFFDISPSKYL